MYKQALYMHVETGTIFVYTNRYYFRKKAKTRLGLIYIGVL